MRGGRVVAKARPGSFIDVARARRSIREFDSRPVAPELIDQIVQEGLLAPSWSNTRPYRVAVATGEVRERISGALLERADAILDLRSKSWGRRLRGLRHLGGFVGSDFRIPLVYRPDLRRRQYDLAKALYGHLGIARSDISGREREIRRNMEFFGAPVAMFFFARTGMGVYSALDAGHFMQTLMLAAKSHGLDTCAQGFLAFWSGPIREEFEVPPGYKLLCGMSMGYAATSHRNQFVPPTTNLTDITLASKAIEVGLGPRD